MSADPDSLETAIGEAIVSVMTAHEQGVTTKWLAIIETVDIDGERGLWTFAGGSIKAWDTAGMLTYGLHRQLGQTLHEDES